MLAEASIASQLSPSTTLWNLSQSSDSPGRVSSWSLTEEVVGRGGSLSSLGRAGNRHSGCGLSSRESEISLGRLVIVCLTRYTVYCILIEVGAVQIRLERLEIASGDAPAVGKGLTHAGRCRQYWEEYWNCSRHRDARKCSQRSVQQAIPTKGLRQERTFRIY